LVTLLDWPETGFEEKAFSSLGAYFPLFLFVAAPAADEAGGRSRLVCCEFL